MSLQAEKLELIQLLLNTDNPSIIQKIKSVFQSSEEAVDIWDELTKGQKMDLEAAIEESKNNLTVDFDTFMKEHR
jgi:N-methylhydantoinase B/oxoprolinase/acetone carboxylase alpha subunit